MEGPMKGMTSVVTGANSGIGFVVSTGLARLGSEVVMVCRDRAKGEAALAEIKRSTESGSVELLLADLASLQSVRELASEVLTAHERVQVLVNNAGVIIGRRTVTPDGLESTFVVNYLSHFLLTQLLLDRLRRSSPARIVNVSSSAHYRGKMDFQDLQEERGYGASKAYSQSKLAQVLFTHELAKRLEGTGVTVNAVHPGAVRTHWGDEGGALGIVIRIARPFLLSPEEGGKTPMYVATSQEVEGVSGRYFSKMKVVESSKESYDEAEMRKLWDVSMKLCGLSQ